MYKTFNVPVLCESMKHQAHGTTIFMTFVESKMVRSKRVNSPALYMLVFRCEDCEATATIIDEIH